jgi:integrase
LSEHTRGKPERALYGLGCLAGLRQQEAAHLRTGIDVDLAAREIRVQPRTGDDEWGTKTEGSVRVVPVSDELLLILDEHVRLGFAGERYFVHPAIADRPLGSSTIATWTRRDMEAVGLRYGRHVGDALTFHSLRHTFASWLVQRREPIPVVADLIGDDPVMVLKVYGHHSPSDRTSAIASIDRAVREVGDSDISEHSTTAAI